MNYMDDRTLCALIDGESANAVGSHDTLASKRRTAMEFYFGEAKGDLAPPSLENRSKVVSKELMDAVEWIMPALMRVFTGSDDIVRFEPDHEGEEKQAREATQYCGWLFFRKNRGFTILHDAIKNCLIQSMSVVKVFCDKAYDERVERYAGLSDLDMQAFGADPEVELISIHSYSDPMSGAALHDAEFRRRTTRMEIRCEGVPAEDFRFSREASDIESARFVEHRVKRTLSDLRSMGYPAELVDRLAGTLDDNDHYGEEAARDPDDWSPAHDEAEDESQREVELQEVYLRVDYDGDGIAEYRRVVKAGTVIFENDIADDHVFALFCPVLMPYRAVGLGLYDLLEDIQKIKTALTRQTLDNIYISNNQRMKVLDNDQVNLDDLLNPTPGGLIRVKQMDAIEPMVVPFTAGQSLGLIDYFDNVSAARSGVSEFNQGLTGSELSKSKVGSEGVERLQSAAMQRVELIARVLAETGIRRLWTLLLKAAVQYQDRPAQVNIAGRWMTINPREWSNRYDLTISVGMASASRQAQIANLHRIIGLQEKALAVGLATPAHIYNALSRMVEAVGYRDSDQFFAPPSASPQQPQPPDMPIEALALLEAEKIKAQSANQRAQMDSVTELQMERERIASQERQTVAKLQTDIAIENAKIANKPITEPPRDEFGQPLPEPPDPVIVAVQAMAEAVAQLSAGQQQIALDQAQLTAALAAPKRKQINIIRDSNGRVAGAEVNE